MCLQDGMQPRKMAKWTPEQEEFLRTHYPIEGRDWCAEKLGMSQASIRQKASRLKLRARGVSKTWHKAQKEHGNKLRGRKRPEHSSLMKKKYFDGKILNHIHTDEWKQKTKTRMKDWLKYNEHPKGMKGKKHSKETCEIIGAKSKQNWQKMTQKEKQERNVKIIKSRFANGALVQPRKASWKSGWRDFGGKRHYYRSRWEANYGRYLEWLKSKGEILEWEHEPEVFWFEGVKRGTVSYLPDFRVTNKNGSIEYHEVKGWMDARSKTKIKRMAKYHPDVKLIVIEKKQYEAIKGAVSKLIEGWE